jgi:hypothetical protein
MWSATEAFASGLPPALTCPFASNTLPSEMLSGLIVTLFVTLAVPAASDALTAAGCVLRASVSSGDTHPTSRNTITTAANTLLRIEWSTIHTFS